jgi:predicted alpha/beta hydrolase
MFSSPNEKVCIQSEDGVFSRITVFRNTMKRAPIVIIMPAMGVNASFYTPFALSLVKRGLNVVTADLRGHGESSIRPDRTTDFGYSKMVLYDWPCIIAQVKMLFPHSPAIILGHSLGGQLSILYLSENPAAIDRLIMVAAPSLFYKDWRFPRSIALLFSTQIFHWIAKAFGNFPGRKIGIGGTEAVQLVGDWARVVRKGRYDMINPSVDYESRMRMLQIPVLAISFADDGYAPKRAVDRLCQKMPHTSLTRWHFAPEDFGCKKLGHFWWINQSEPLTERISRWLTDVLNKSCQILFSD